jgi:hypothetical protein
MKKFEYLTRQIESKDPDDLDNELLKWNNSKWGLVTVLPLQLINQNKFIPGAPPEVKMILNLIFKAECQE